MAVSGAGLEGVIAAESRICYIDGKAGVLSYQGFNIHTLAEHATFEEVVYLLWNGRLPKRDELGEWDGYLEAAAHFQICAVMRLNLSTRSMSAALRSNRNCRSPRRQW